MNLTQWSLHQSGLFNGLDRRRFAALLAEVETRTYPAGAVIFGEGDGADGMYVVQDGAVQVFTVVRDGATVVLAKYGEGAHFGEQALLGGPGGRRAASVRAWSDVTLVYVRRESFQRLLDEDHPLKQRLLELGAQQVRQRLAHQTVLFRALALGEGAAPEAREVQFAEGEVLFREGDPPDGLYLILAGRAAIYRKESGRDARISTQGEGQCVGEMALLRRTVRSATVVADTPLRAIRVETERFLQALESSAELREHIKTVERIHNLPSRGLATQCAGTWMDRPSITTLYDLEDGRRLVAERVVGDDIFSLVTPGDAVAPDAAGDGGRLLVHEADEGRTVREVRLDARGVVVGLSVRGYWSELPVLLEAALAGAPLAELVEADAFARDGRLLARAAPPPEEQPICACMRIPRGTLVQLIKDGCRELGELQARTRCGTVCGACVPSVAELLGDETWTPVTIGEESPLAVGIRSFRLVPTEGEVLPSHPGQHLVVQAWIDGSWVQRSYTLSTARGERAHYEITVKREPHGLFSRWLFDGMDAGRRLRVSRPRGQHYWEPGQRPAVCLVAGIGVTPALAIVRTVVREQLTQRVHVDYSVRTRHELVCEAELAAAAAAFPNVTYQVRETSSSARIGTAEIRALAERLPDAVFLLCGPTAYLDDVSQALRHAGVLDARIRIEAFVHAGDAVRPSQAAARVGVPSPAPSRSSATSAVLDELLAPPPATPPPAGGIAGFAKRAAGALSVAMNDPRGDWAVRGRQLNPARAGAHLLAARVAGLDPHLPLEYGAVAGSIGLGPTDQMVRAFERLEAQHTSARERAGAARAAGQPLPPNTPDGQTYAMAVPKPPMTRYTGPLAVDTGWTSYGDRALLPIVVTRSRHVMRQVLGDPSRFDRGALPYHNLQQLAGISGACPVHDRKPAGVFAGQLHNNRTWEEHRRLGNEAFAPQAADLHVVAMSAALRRWGDEIDARLGDGERIVDADVLMSRLAYHIVILVTFGDLDPDAFARLGAALREPTSRALDFVGKQNSGLPGDPRRFQDDLRTCRTTIAEIIARVRKAHEDGHLTAAHYRNPILKMIVYGGESGPLSVDEISPFLMVAVIAGHETTGHTMSWAVYHLARDPALLRAVQEEVNAFYAGDPDRIISGTHCHERPITQALLYEVGRVHPPIAAIPRTALADGEIPPDPETGIGGFGYRKDTMFLCSFLGTHRDPARYPDPARFDVARFLPAATPGMSRVERGRLVWEKARQLEEGYELITFGQGPGRCLGQQFNMVEFFTVLDWLMRRYDFELVDPTRPVRDVWREISGPETGGIAIRLRRKR